MVDISKRCSELSVALLPKLYPASQKLIEQQLLLSEEKIYLIQSLSEISNRCSKYDQQEEIIDHILMDPENEFNSEELTKILLDSKLFLTHIGLIGIEENKENFINGFQNRTNLLNLLTIFKKILKHLKPYDHFKFTDETVKIEVKKIINRYTPTPNPLVVKHFHNIMQNLGLIARQINFIYSEDAESLFNEQLKSFLNPIPSIQIETNSFSIKEEFSEKWISKQDLTNYLYYSQLNENNYDQQFVYPLALSYWLYYVRKRIYQIIFLGCRGANTEFYNLKDLDEFLSNYLLDYLPTINLPDLSSLVEKVICPFFLNVPLNKFDSLIVKYYPSIFQFLSNKLETLWESYQELLSNSNSNDDDEENELLINENIIDFTYSILAMFGKIFSFTASKKSRHSQNNSPYTKHKIKIINLILNNDELIQPVCSIFYLLIKIPDSLCLEHTIKIFSRCAHFFNNIKFKDFIYSILLSTAIEGLTTRKKEVDLRHLVELINVIHESFYESFDRDFFKILSSLNNVDPKQIQQLQMELNSVQYSNERQHIFKAFFENVFSLTLYQKVSFRVSENSLDYLLTSQSRSARRRGLSKKILITNVIEEDKINYFFKF